jgi:hypothetical protein
MIYADIIGVMIYLASAGMDDARKFAVIHVSDSGFVSDFGFRI